MLIGESAFKNADFIYDLTDFIFRPDIQIVLIVIYDMPRNTCSKGCYPDFFKGYNCHLKSKTKQIITYFPKDHTGNSQVILDVTWINQEEEVDLIVKHPHMTPKLLY